MFLFYYSSFEVFFFPPLSLWRIEHNLNLSVEEETIATRKSHLRTRLEDLLRDETDLFKPSPVFGLSWRAGLPGSYLRTLIVDKAVPLRTRVIRVPSNFSFFFLAFLGKYSLWASYYWRTNYFKLDTSFTNRHLS